MKAAQAGEANRFELLVQSITDYAIYMLDPTGTVTSWNAGAERFKGYTADEIIGRHFSNFYTDADRRAGLPQTALKTALEEGQFEAGGWRVRKDGTHFWASVVIDPVRDATGTLVGFAKITRDLTERRKSQEALRQSEERFRLLVESVTDYAIYMLDPTGIVASWNAGAQRFKGYTADEIMGQHFSRFYGEEDRAAGIPATALRTAETEGRFEAEGWRIRKDGTRFWANVVIDPVRDPTGKLIGFAKVTRDLTERREAQRALERAQEAFFQSQKMDAIGKLTGGVAHDFNNLLAAVIGSLDLARRRMAEGGNIERFINNAMQAAERGAALTQRMLAFARKQELSLETVDLSRLVREMAELLERTIGAGVEIETHFPLKLKCAHADAAQLELAILNLAVNARDAMPGGGKIVISADEARVGRERGGIAPGHYVRVTVTDTGEGMDQATLTRAMEPFFTTKGVGKGTGLGLSMVHGFAEQGGGMLELQSTPGAGTAATIWLPVADDMPAPNVVAAQRVRPLRAAKALCVLAVDDDPLVLNNTAAMLEDLGHTVLEASSGKAALDILASNRIDVVVTDYAMPEMTGIQLANALAAGWPTIGLVLVSGYAEIPQGETVRLLRLSKPFREVQLAQAVAQAMAERDAGARVIPLRKS